MSRWTLRCTAAVQSNPTVFLFDKMPAALRLAHQERILINPSQTICHNPYCKNTPVVNLGSLNDLTLYIRHIGNHSCEWSECLFPRLRAVMESPFISEKELDQLSKKLAPADPSKLPCQFFKFCLQLLKILPNRVQKSCRLLLILF